MTTILNGMGQDVQAMQAMEHCVEKTDGAILNGLDALFTVTGGPVLAQIYGVVSEIIVGNSSLRLQHISVVPGTTTELNAGAVAVNDDAAGTSYYNVGATSVFTPVTPGTVILSPVTVEPCWFLLPVGTAYCLGDAARVGVIKWYMLYRPLSPNSLVVAAA